MEISTNYGSYDVYFFVMKQKLKKTNFDAVMLKIRK